MHSKAGGQGKVRKRTRERDREEWMGHGVSPFFAFFVPVLMFYSPNSPPT